MISSPLESPSTPNLTSSLARSRRSQFSGADNGNTSAEVKIRILYEYERLLHYSKSPHAWALPAEWTKICLKAPHVVRDKVNKDGAQILQRSYSWLQARESGVDTNNNNNNTHSTKTTHHHPQQQTVKFQRNLSFDDNSRTSLSTTAGAQWTRKSFDAKRNPLLHSKSVCD